MTADEQYKLLLDSLVVSPTYFNKPHFVGPRGMRTREHICYRTEVDMRYPIVTILERKIDYEFMAAEAAWVLSGDARITHPVINRNLKKYSDTGISMSGAYGPMFIEQYRYVIDKLKEDRESRQAVMTFWRPNPRDSKDIPCTCTLQFLIRNSKIHLNVFMRSSDAWLGWPYDVFTFTMIASYVGISLDLFYGKGTIDLGTLTIIAGSQHVYERHWELLASVRQSNNCGDYQPMSLHWYNHPDNLLADINAIGNAYIHLDTQKTALSHLYNLVYANKQKSNAPPAS